MLKGKGAYEASVVFQRPLYSRLNFSSLVECELHAPTAKEVFAFAKKFHLRGSTHVTFGRGEKLKNARWGKPTKCGRETLATRRTSWNQPLGNKQKRGGGACVAPRLPVRRRGGTEVAQGPAG